MNQIIEFLNKNKFGNLATCADCKPDCRPFEFVFYCDKGLFFYTSTEKDVYMQLKTNPDICFCATDERYNYVKIRGAVLFSDDVQDKEKIIEKSSFAKKIYSNADNEKLKVFYIPHGEGFLHFHDKEDVITESF